MIQAEYSDGSEENLSADDKEALETIMAKIRSAAKLVKPPLDPKIEALLDVAFEMCSEQLSGDKKYTWGPPTSMDDKFYHEKNIPSADDLKDMFEKD